MEMVSIVGLDIAKNAFHAHGASANGAKIFSKALPRGRVLEFMGKIDPCIVALEACSGAHYWGRELQKLGHDVRLIAPQYVKPYVKRQKNDALDAEAIVYGRPRGCKRFFAMILAEAVEFLRVSGLDVRPVYAAGPHGEFVDWVQIGIARFVPLGPGLVFPIPFSSTLCHDLLSEQPLPLTR